MVAASSPPGRSTRVIAAMTCGSGVVTSKLIEQTTTSTLASRSGIAKARARRREPLHDGVDASGEVGLLPCRPAPRQCQLIPVPRRRDRPAARRRAGVAAS